MSNTLTKQQKYQRLQELFDLAGERCLAAGGDLHKSTNCNVYLSEKEQKEFKVLANELSTKAADLR